MSYRLFRLFRKGLPAAATILLTASTVLSAAEPKGLDFSVKFRAGATAGNLKDDTHSNKLMGLGIAGSYALGDGGAFIGELNYTYFGGGEYDAMPTSGTFYYNPAAPSATYLGNAVYIGVAAPSASTDARKNRLEGFGARFGYSRRFTESWAWQAGICLDRYQSRQEVAGTLRPVYLVGATMTLVPGGYYESLTATPTATKLGIGAFGGLKTAIGDNFSFEANLVSVGYSQINYVPFTYSGQAATTTSSNRHGLALELVFGLKL